MTSRRVRARGLAVLAMAGLAMAGLLGWDRPARASTELLLLLRPPVPAGTAPVSPASPTTPPLPAPPGPAA
ncbi:MAG: hypothetical protein ACRCVA_31345, partial [Phreatobacter sp.]